MNLDSIYSFSTTETFEEYLFFDSQELDSQAYAAWEESMYNPNHEEEDWEEL